MGGVEYWRAWSRREDGNIIDDAQRITGFYAALVRHCKRLDDEMPIEIVRELGMDGP
jgi:hypothetical protein